MNQARLIEDIVQSRFVLADHRVAWPRILPGLQALHDLGPLQDWSIASVRAMLDADRAFLLTDEADPSAFAVCMIDEYPYDSADTELFIYLVWHQGGTAIERFQPHMEQVARSAGAKHIRFYSPRIGMLRAALDAGYIARSVEYVKELNHGRR